MSNGTGAPRFTLPARCPVCGGEMEVARYHCPACDTTLEGHFAGCRFCLLDFEQRRLVEVLLQARGNLREVERELGISYPTVRARLEAALAALGLAPSTGASPGSPGWPPGEEPVADRPGLAARSRGAVGASGPAGAGTPAGATGALGAAGGTAAAAGVVTARKGAAATRPGGAGEAALEELRSRRRDVLEALDRGEVSVDEALRRLRGDGG